MRVGIVCPYDLSRPGGVQAQVLGLADSLRDQGDEAQVIGPGLPDGVPGVDLGGTIAFPGNRSRVPVSLDPRLTKVMKVVSRDLDLLHVHEPLMPAASLAALRAGPPVVATFHADPSRLARRAYSLGRSRLQRVLGGKVKAITAVSPTAASALPDDLDLTIVPNGVDTSAMRVPVARDPRLVVFLGRDEPRKGLNVLLRAWDRISEDVPDAHLSVMGADRGIDGIDWMGDVDDKTKVETLNRAAVYVAPNTGGESFGIVLVEAMAAGAAVVASDLPAFRDVGESAARYFPVRDSRALAETVVSVLTDHPSRDAMASRGIERAGEFEWSSVTERYRRVYESALA
ncbi:MAG: glycosyltransferase family 4 protein [Actinomycetota bacterium]|nr:glycosyltransferase family 4 protein [Actinomycetota bacterium]